MSTRTDRYKAAVVLAQVILEDEPRFDEFHLQQAIDDIVDEVRAGRRNQQDFAKHAERVLDLIHASRWLNDDVHSRRVPNLRVVEEDAS